MGTVLLSPFFLPQQEVPMGTVLLSSFSLPQQGLSDIYIFPQQKNAARLETSRTALFMKEICCF